MKPILSRGGPFQELNALFMQPTRWCGLNCKGCYVKEHVDGEESYHTSWHEQWRLFNQFYKGPHWANQITIAVDDLHQDPTKQRHMLLLVDAILSDLVTDVRPKNERPEVHMTLHTTDTLDQYLNERVGGWIKLDMISFSQLPLHLNKPYNALGYFDGVVPINYNYMAPLTFNPEREIKHLTKAALFVDHIYLVMFKDPVGKPVPQSLANYHMHRYQLYISQVVDKLPEDVRRKLTTDGCMSDTIKHSRTGFGCSSNVSRLQVWPDGSVSGCPYAFSGSTPIGRTAEAILENIRQARNRYDFKEDCHLPSTYATLTNRSLPIILS
jgi:hypothetical protein